MTKRQRKRKHRQRRHHNRTCRSIERYVWGSVKRYRNGTTVITDEAWMTPYDVERSREAWETERLALGSWPNALEAPPVAPGWQRPSDPPGSGVARPERTGVVKSSVPIGIYQKVDQWNTHPTTQDQSLGESLQMLCDRRPSPTAAQARSTAP